MIPAMSEKSHDSVLGSLPHSRPHRRSEKRAARPAAPAVVAESEATAKPITSDKPTKPEATNPAKPEARKPTKPEARKPTKPDAGKPTGPKATKPAKPKATKPAETRTASRKVRESAATAPKTAPEQSPNSSHTLPGGTELVGTVVKATAELAEIGLTVGTRALRIALSRLPRP
jgi:hypothetical protein